MASPTLLIDGDMLVYSAAIATEYTVWWDEDWAMLAGNLPEAIELIQTRMSHLDDIFKPGKSIVTLTDPVTTFRKALDPTYKAGRSRKPLTYWQLRDWLVQAYETVQRPNLEADDVMGILATSSRTKNPIMISDDKDMLTIPGTLWRGGKLTETTPEEADYNWLTQTITGDPTDGYIGCRGAGPSKAARMFKKHGVSYATVVKVYEEAGYTADDALRNARLARILRYEDWDAKNQVVRLWQPEHMDATKEPQEA